MEFYLNRALEIETRWLPWVMCVIYGEDIYETTTLNIKYRL